MRSLPEKTLEHWTGLYLASRFPRANQWWPTLGEDVALTLRSSLTSPGKVVLLEVKVPEVRPAGHQLSISTAQLGRYLARRLPVFYVLPVPRWSGSLDPGSTGPRPAAGWWRQRSENWFGDWTYVLSAADVARQISMSADNPVLYTVPNGGTTAGSLPPTLTDAFLWQDFWWEVQACGPVGTVRWRITKDGPDKVTVTNLAEQEQVGFVAEEETFGFSALQDQLLVQQGDNLVVVHIDEEQLYQAED